MWSTLPLPLVFDGDYHSPIHTLPNHPVSTWCPSKLCLLTVMTLAAGLWMPQASDVSALRQDMDQNPQRIKRILNDADVRKQFMNGIPDDEKKAVKAFVSQNQESALKSKPMVRLIFLDKAPIPIKTGSITLWDATYNNTSNLSVMAAPKRSNHTIEADWSPSTRHNLFHSRK